MPVQRADPLPQGISFRAFWEFCRPHTIIGTTMAVLVLYGLASMEAGHQDLSTLVLSYIAALGVNIYIVGLNQVTDVEIDRINKPYLPLASGAFDQPLALLVICLALAVALSIAASQGGYMFGTIAIVFAIGTAYSLPPLRFKERPFWAAASITTARALVSNIGYYLHYTDRLAGKPSLPAGVLAFVTFMFVFVIVIAIMKDVPDIEGDRQWQVRTLAQRLGVDGTLQLCRWILTAACIGFGAISLAVAHSLSAPVVLATHIPVIAAIWFMGSKVDSKDSKSVYRYYMLLWKLYYLEFLAFPIAMALSKSH